MTQPTDHSPFPEDPEQFQKALATLVPSHIGMIPRDRRINRRKFTPEEDEALRNLVAHHGTGDWCVIARGLHERSQRQCRDRWKHYLAPEISQGNWTEAEERMLVSKVEEMGQRWSTIAQMFPGRTDIRVKNQYISIVNRRGKDSRERVTQRAVMMPMEPQRLGDDGSQVSLDLPPPGIHGMPPQ